MPIFPFSGVVVPIQNVVDDIVIVVSASQIDGPGGGLAWAGPRVLRGAGDNFLPSAAEARFDSADLTDPDLFDIALHEIGHALGIGTIWNNQGLLNLGAPPAPNFLGVDGTNEYNSIFGQNAPGVPVEDSFGPGTALAHWELNNRNVLPGLGNELMTGFIFFGDNPLSRITAASLGDLGYEVDVDWADPFMPPSTLQSDESNLESEIVGFDLVVDFDNLITLGGRAFNDVNQNNVLDEGIDSLLSNVVVTLRDILGDPIDTTVTDAEGSYEFQNLTPANYIVSFEFDFGNTPVIFVDPFQGNDPLLDSDVVETTSEFPLSGITDTIVLITEQGFVTEDIFGINAGVVALEG